MAVINLPNGASWDTTKKSMDQTPLANDYAQGVMDSGEKVIDTEEEVGASSGIFRFTKQHYDDAPNALRVVMERVYKYPATDKACFTVTEHKMNIENIV